MENYKKIILIFKIIFIIQRLKNELSLVFISLTHFYCQTQDILYTLYLKLSMYSDTFWTLFGHFSTIQFKIH